MKNLLRTLFEKMKSGEEAYFLLFNGKGKEKVLSLAKMGKLYIVEIGERKFFFAVGESETLQLKKYLQSHNGWDWREITKREAQDYFVELLEI